MANHGSDYTYEYDVFLCFRRGVHRAFIDHLCKALDGIGIKTFKDAADKEEESATEKEETTSPDVLEKIERSRTAVVVFCKDFPFSTRCLDEVGKIMECYQEKRMQVVVPIFYYGVGAADVRWQRKDTTYGVAFSQHQERLLGKESDKIETWRSALRGACGLIGIGCHQHMKEDELISMIVKDVSARLPPPLRFQIKDVFGLDSRFEELKSNLDIGNNKAVRMLAIYGPPGIGKTTFAAHIFNKLISNDDQYAAASFISNIRDRPIVEDLQSTLLVEMREKRESKKGDTKDGAQEIKRKLGVKKVLLVLDDVDKIDQLKSLAGGCDWFGPGSRIIITTRHPNLPNRHRDRDTIKKYQMRELNHDDSLKLFCWHAFGKSQLVENFADFVTQALRIAKGSPLALKALGTELKDRSLEEWEVNLQRFSTDSKALESLLR
ncbi:hypothetical protein PIB30_034470 [Stylosanthes scabra]|uniref:TIR domain-containing protein n=1 Tax=Stylosanthes scabra TaxID=79078 RepID=A0ABU6UDD6_9FABA|nr:hypothetical protein [Stylosanthes scabra]